MVQDTLFDEGLRIAQQYGMADFAEQLMELQQQKPKSNNSAMKPKTFDKKVNGNCSHKSNGNETEDDEVMADDDDVVVDEDSNNNNSSNNNNNNNNNNSNNNINNSNNSNSSRSNSNSRCPSHSGSGGEDSPCKPPAQLLTKNNGVADTDNENSTNDNVIRASCHIQHERDEEEEEEEEEEYYREGKKMLMEDSVANEMLLRDTRIKESSKNYLGGAIEHSILQNGECAN